MSVAMACAVGRSLSGKIGFFPSFLLSLFTLKSDPCKSVQIRVHPWANLDPSLTTFSRFSCTKIPTLRHYYGKALCGGFLMRLTLRTLLAYLDDTLDPAQAHDIGHKVAESPVAQELVERIRKVTRRRSLANPPVQGDATKLDPNTVAEYLSDSLS